MKIFLPPPSIVPTQMQMPATTSAVPPAGFSPPAVISAPPAGDVFKSAPPRLESYRAGNAGASVLTRVHGVRGYYDIESGEHFDEGARPGRRPKKPTSKGQHTPGRMLDRKSDARVFTFGDREIRVWSPDAGQDANLMTGLANLARYPDVHPFIAVMPDYHLGESSINGTVIPSRNTLYVNAIGGDIGCGMTCARLPLTLDEVESHLREIYEDIYARVPSGRRSHSHPSDMVRALPLFDVALDVMNKANTKSAMQQFGTLGSGNHFVEIQANAHGDIFVMIHTGSRVLGQHIRTYGTRRGQALSRPKGVVSIDADSDAGKAYLSHVEYAVRYASANRMEILRQVIEAFRQHIPSMGDVSPDEITGSAIDAPHNYIAMERHFGEEVYVHRKGAISAARGDRGVIPGSMGTPSYIVRGRGNEASLESSSHGAGRRMTRGEAMRSIRKEEFEASMSGIISRRDNSIYDEAPGAYKDIREIMGYQRDLVAIEEELRPLAVVKG